MCLKHWGEKEGRMLTRKVLAEDNVRKGVGRRWELGRKCSHINVSFVNSKILFNQQPPTLHLHPRPPIIDFFNRHVYVSFFSSPHFSSHVFSCHRFFEYWKDQ